MGYFGCCGELDGDVLLQFYEILVRRIFFGRTPVTLMSNRTNTFSLILRLILFYNSSFFPDK